MKMKLTSIFLFIGAGTCLLADPLKEIRALYAEVNAAAVRHDGYSYQDDESPRSGEISIFTENGGGIRKVSAETILDDHSSRNVEVFHDKADHVRFIIFSENSWRFSPTEDDENATLDLSEETRLYFDGKGELLSALKKSYSGTTADTVRAAAKAAVNQKMAVGSMAAERARVAAGYLKRSESSADARAAEDRLANAIALLGESNPPAEPEAWILLEWPKGTQFADTFSVSGAAHEILRLAEIAVHGPEAPPTVVETLLSPTSVLITMDRLQDDSVRSQRYRIDFAFGEDRVWKPKFFGKQIRCHEGRGHQDWSKELCP